MIESHWFIYIFPLYRSIAFLQGITLSVVYREIKTKSIIKKLDLNQYTIIEICSILIFILLYLFASQVELAYVYDVYFILIIMVIILIMSLSKGRVAKVMNNKKLAGFASNVMYFFMLHQICIRYVSWIGLKLHISEGFIILGCLLTSFLAVSITKKILRTRSD